MNSQHLFKTTAVLGAGFVLLFGQPLCVLAQSFASPVAYGSGGQSPLSVVVADLNGDGKPDLVVTNCNGDPGDCGEYVGSVGVLLGNGDGTFQTTVRYGSGGLGAYAVAVADVNGDSKPDLLVVNICAHSACQHGSVSVLLGNGDGTFRTPVGYDSGGYRALSVAVADVNGDAKPDLLVANDTVGESNARGSVSVLLGNGDGTFQTPVGYGSGGFLAYAVAVADVNGDHKPDILVSNDCSDSNRTADSSVGALLGRGDGTFRKAVAYGTGGQGAFSLAVADVNGDGNADLLVANLCANSGECGNEIAGGSVGVLLGNGNGAFQTAVAYRSGGINGRSAAVGDVNNDGKPDLLVVNWCSKTSSCSHGTVSVLLNTE